MINHDTNRESRTGVPEVILAEPKSNTELVASIQIAVKSNKEVLITRINESQRKSVDQVVIELSLQKVSDDYDRTIILSQNEIDLSLSTDYKVGILSAGTSDEKYVQEIETTLKFLKLGYKSFKDIGVAGLHRHKEALLEIHSDQKFKCLIVVAGQDGALFPVVSAQTSLPLIAVPTPIGYGYGGKGETALQTALQSCSPGVVVVNIENGFGASVFANKMIRQI